MNHDAQFQQLHDIFVADLSGHDKECKVSNCHILRRNYRDRSQSNRTKLSQMYHCTDIHDLNRFQLLDKIHCYYFHSINMAQRLSDCERLTLKEAAITSDEKQNDSQLFSVCDSVVISFRKLIQSKRHSFRNADGFNRLMASDRFSTTFSTKVDELDFNLYNYGVRYFYWNYYKDKESVVDPIREGIKECYGIHKNLEKTAANKGFMLKDMYVAPKFVDLKTELLNNSICTIQAMQWDVLLQKAIQHLRTAYCRHKVCVQPKEIYKITTGTIITDIHLIAIMVYCNFDMLQHKFSKTYRQISKKEDHISMVARHRNFANLGRLLRECVECFPSRYTRKYCWTSLYHGITIEKPTFMSMNACIKTPVSTTTDFTVAVNFCNNEGPILEFNLDDHWVKISEAMLCECWYLSDFASEKEIFFIGGFSYFLMQTIIFPNGDNFIEYIFALNAISDHFNLFKSNSSQYLSINSRQEHMCFRLMSHHLHTHYPLDEKYYGFESMPTYVQGLVKRHFENMEFCAFPMPGFIGKVFDSLFCYDNGWINLDIFTTVFPSIATINFLIRCYLKKKSHNAIFDNIYSSLLALIGTKSHVKLQKVKISFPMENKEEEDKCIHRVVDSYKLKYKQLGWEIYVEKEMLSKCIVISQPQSSQSELREYYSRSGKLRIV